MSPTQRLSPRLQQTFARLIANRLGLTLRKSDQADLQVFIFNRLREMGLDAPEKYYLLLNENTARSHQEWLQLISVVTNTESFFFRDKGQFSLLKNYLLPTLIEKKSDKKRLRICSAGCSTGEEPYSIAILLTDLISNLNSWDLKIVGIDINPVAIEKAQTGVYRPWSFRGIEPEIKERFFSESNGHYKIDRAIQSMVDFKVVNLVDSSFLDPTLDLTDMDLIVCRNVFIYFSSSAIKSVLNKFYDALRPSGYLMVGHAELHSQDLKKLHTQVFDESIAYQRPVDDIVQSPAEALALQPPLETKKEVTETAADQALDQLFQGSDIKMNQVALNLLRQLPNDSRIAKLGNLTAAELISQLENKLKDIE